MIKDPEVKKAMIEDCNYLIMCDICNKYFGHSEKPLDIGAIVCDECYKE